MKSDWKKIAERGSMMVEALAMLGLITMVTPVLYKKAAERTTELQDINTATQMRTLSKALDDYIADNYDDLSTEGNQIDIGVDELSPYLPHTFNTEASKLFSEYKATILHNVINEGATNEHSAFTGMVLAKSQDELPRIRASKIASMVGANGGVVIVDDTGKKQIQGVQGGWGAELGTFFEEGDVAPGSLVTSSVHAVTASGGGAANDEDVLYRTGTKGPEYNTMQVSLIMGTNPIEEVNEIIAASDGNDNIVLKAGNVEATGNLQTTGNLQVDGADGATITNLLTAGSANIAGIFNVDSSGVSSDKKVTITAEGLDVQAGGATITGDTTITGGTTTINEKVKIDTNGTLTADNRAVVKGGTGAAETLAEADAALVADGSILIKNNARILGDMRIENALSAESLYGRHELGGGLLEDGESYNFVANDTDVSVIMNTFRVGSQLEIDGESDGDWQLVHLEGKGMDGWGYIDIGKDVDGVRIRGNETTLDVDNSSITADAPGGISLRSANSEHISHLKMNPEVIGMAASDGAMVFDANGVYVGKGSLSRQNIFTSSGPHASFTETAAVITGAGGVTAPKVDLSGGEVKTEGDYFRYNDNFIMNNNDIVFDENALIPANHDRRTSGVRISRQGIIDIAPGTKPAGGDSSIGRADTPGYIRIDRMLANHALEEVVDEGTGKHFSGTGVDTTATQPYDAYQVNPAYTSVMHDIKLTTRGGARLSDILPDFINKGIYVLDNTYEESNDTRSWEKYHVTVGVAPYGYEVTDGPADCPSNDADCIASPWLGFVPTPQCPPGYSKVITISPIRWKMSEAYYISGETPTVEGVGPKFRRYFQPLTDPMKAKFELETADGSGGSHTHGVKQGWPLTFQTNTWLNTTVSGVREGKTAEESSAQGGQRISSFIGWHAIMGFLYYGSHYTEWLNKVSPGKNYDNLVIWNLFPVYNQEMTAIANVYCYFERRDMTNPDWRWNTSLVDGGGDGYNQLTNFRYGFTKNNDAYNKRLNDPALGYDEVW